MELEQLLNKVKQKSFDNMSINKLSKTNLLVDEQIHKKGFEINAREVKIQLKKDSVYVFADEAPEYNWAHPCRYLLFDAEDGEQYDEIKANFPPDLVKVPQAFRNFHQPKIYKTTLKKAIYTKYDWAKQVGSKISFWLRGKRYAILFSGASNNRHLNDLESLYRTLIDIYGFNKDNIYVLNYDGTINYSGSPQPIGKWPGDDTDYKIPVNYNGTKAEFETVFDILKNKLKVNDFLLIHTNNHGGLGANNETYLCTYSGSDYYSSDFGDKLAELPKFAKLMVMMEQCHSGGFENVILDNSPAEDTSFAAACEWDKSSIGGADFDPFARDWISAMTGIDPYGNDLDHDPDTYDNGKISATEAFNYAEAVKHSYDTPVYGDTPVNCGDNMYLGLLDPYIILRKLFELLEIKVELPREPWPPDRPFNTDKTMEIFGMIEKITRTSRYKKPELEKFLARANRGRVIRR